jgi:hypothetical protein
MLVRTSQRSPSYPLLFPHLSRASLCSGCWDFGQIGTLSASHGIPKSELPDCLLPLLSITHYKNPTIHT